MKFEVRIDGKTRAVELTQENGRRRVSLDGRATDADAAAIASDAISVLLDGRSYEIHVTPRRDGAMTVRTAHREWSAEVLDPRAWRGRRHGGVEAEGRQQITAPMPGKVVRVLVETGQKVEIGQGLVVVEAMKMQNEVRSPKSGTIERLMAKEGQPVNAGEVLVVVA